LAENTIATDTTEQQAVVFKVLADPTRLQLVKHLCHQHEPDALCVNALAELLGITQSAVSQHLRILKGIGLVRGERRGYSIHYCIDHQTLERCHQIILSALAGEDTSEDSL
jgi:DNA-binding transcriptional ArsR family regulator